MTVPVPDRNPCQALGSLSPRTPGHFHSLGCFVALFVQSRFSEGSRGAWDSAHLHRLPHLAGGSPGTPPGWGLSLLLLPPPSPRDALRRPWGTHPAPACLPPGCRDFLFPARTPPGVFSPRIAARPRLWSAPCLQPFPSRGSRGSHAEARLRGLALQPPEEGAGDPVGPRRPPPQSRRSSRLARKARESLFLRKHRGTPTSCSDARGKRGAWSFSSPGRPLDLDAAGRRVLPTPFSVSVVSVSWTQVLPT